MDLRTALRVLRERWTLVVVATVLAVLAGAGYTLRQTPLYTARATMFVSAWGGNPGNGGNDTSAAYQGSLLSEQRVKSYTQLLRGELVMRAVIDQNHLKLTPAQLASRITAEVVPDTVLLAVNVTDSSPRQARDVANAVCEQFAKLVLELESSSDGRASPVRLSIVSRAGLPATPVSPNAPQNIVLSLLLGLTVGGALAAACHTLDTTVKDVKELTDLTNAPSLGTVPVDPNAQKTPLVINDSPYALRAEAFRKIRTSMQFVDLDRSNKIILVTSSLAGEGKSTTACNLAISVAEAGKKVLLVEADLRRPRAARYLGLPNGVGLTSVLVGSATSAVATQSWGDLLSVLASGPLPPNPSELLGSAHMRHLLQQFRQQYDLVVIDGPPVLPVADAAAMANACDGTIVVVRHGKTKRDQVTDTINALRTVDAQILGTVMNLVPVGRSSQYYYQEYGPLQASPDGPQTDVAQPETVGKERRVYEPQRDGGKSHAAIVNHKAAAPKAGVSR